MSRSHSSSSCWRMVGFALGLLGYVAPIAAQTAPSAVIEDKIKAAYLYNFTKFIEWPPVPSAQADKPFVIGVVDPQGDTFAVVEETLRGKSTPSGDPIVVRRLTQLGEEAPELQLLFIAREAEVDAGVARAWAKTAPVLLVGETEHFAARGGAIGLLMAGDNVRFEVNLAAAQRAGLKLSGRLASVAHLVREQPRP